MGWGEELDVVALKAISHNLPQSPTIFLNLPQSPSATLNLPQSPTNLVAVSQGGDAQSPSISLNLPQAAAMPKESGSRPRVVIFTQGKDHFLDIS